MARKPRFLLPVYPSMSHSTGITGTQVSILNRITFVAWPIYVKLRSKIRSKSMPMF